MGNWMMRFPPIRTDVEVDTASAAKMKRDLDAGGFRPRRDPARAFSFAHRSRSRFTVNSISTPGVLQSAIPASP